MGPSPGTGLFVHEPRASKSRYSRESKDDGKSMADQEEEKINGRLVEILERKCAKLRSRAEQEEKNRKTLQEELEELRPRCEELQREVCDLRAAHEKLAEDRQEALRRNGELANIQQQCGVAQQALQDRDVELRQLQEQQARSEEQWKAQIVKLVEEMRRAEQKSSTLAKELAASKGELQRLKAGGQDVVRRYEEESGRRLELEERCLQLEEKLKTREQRTRNDADCAHKLKQCQQAKEVAEQQAKENEERSQKAAERLEEVESRQKDLEAEVQRLKLQCSEKSRRIEELEAASVQEMEPLGPSGPPRPPIPRSRPGTASSAGSASVGTSRVGAGDSRKLRTQPPAFQSHGERLPPGAIRRGGSVPVRRSQGPPPRANLQSRSISPNASASQRTPPSARTKSPQTERPVSQSSHGSCGEDGFDGIPTDSEDSSEEEVLTGVNTAA